MVIGPQYLSVPPPMTWVATELITEGVAWRVSMPSGQQQ